MSVGHELVVPEGEDPTARFLLGLGRLALVDGQSYTLWEAIVELPPEAYPLTLPDSPSNWQLLDLLEWASVPIQFDDPVLATVPIETLAAVIALVAVAGLLG
ncbi:MAG: hypothetical protein H0V84_01410 [Actinobacteria bacterium]|nr:hypothetical protein [Actinomycetota bacterium]